MEKNNPQDPTPQQTSDDQKIEELLTFITQTIKDLDERDQKLEKSRRELYEEQQRLEIEIQQHDEELALLNKQSNRYLILLYISIFLIFAALFYTLSKF